VFDAGRAERLSAPLPVHGATQAWCRGHCLPARAGGWMWSDTSRGPMEGTPVMLCMANSNYNNRPASSSGTRPYNTCT
jgi:hypothetical protein